MLFVVYKKLKPIAFLAVFLLFLFQASFAEAVRTPEIQYPQIPFSDVKTPNEFIRDINASTTPAEDILGLYVRYFYSLIVIIGALAVFASIVYGGFQYLLGIGKPGLLVVAKDRISSGLLGLIILFSAQFILTAINPQLSLFSFTIPESETCDCTRPRDQLSDYCKVYCQVAPTVTEETPVYIEIPLGRLVERVIKATGEWEQIAVIIKSKAETLREKSEKLKNLTDKCSCTNDTKTQCSADGCFGGVCVGEPCPGRSEIDNLIKPDGEIPKLIEELQTWRWKTFLAKSALRQAYTNLKLAEDILRDSVSSPLSFGTYIGLEQRTAEKINHWSNIDITYNPLTNLTTAEDPATFYITKKGNEELIKLVENVAAPVTTPPPAPGTCSAGQTKPYSVCDGTTCVSIDSCGENRCDNCDSMPDTCPAGEARPHSVCDGVICRSVDSCGESACTDSASCVAPPSNCPTGNGPCEPNNLIDPFSGDYIRASAVCQGESGSNPNALANTCGNSSVTYQEYSVGLFQMNLAVGRCNGGVEYTNPECGRAGGFCSTCAILNWDKVRTCENDYGRGADIYRRNVGKAHDLYGYSGWCPWSVGVGCGFCR